MATHNFKILNFPFTLVSDDDKSYIEDVAKRVEKDIKTLSDKLPTRNMTEVALFVAMDYCDSHLKSLKDENAMRAQIKDYLKDSAALREENESLKKELDELKSKLNSTSSEENNTPAADSEQTAVNEDKPEEKTTDDTTPVDSEISIVDTADITDNNDTAAISDTPDNLPSAEVEKPKQTTKQSVKPAKLPAAKPVKEKKPAAPVKGFWNNDDEVADTTDDIMSFFESKAFDDDE